MAKIITFFEDKSLKNFHPLTLTRPIYDLRVGILTLSEKWFRAFNIDAHATGLQRDHLKDLFPSPSALELNDSCYWINPRVFPDKNLVNRIQQLSANSMLTDNNILIAAHLSSELHNTWLSDGINTSDLNESIYSDSFKILDNIWQIFQFNGEEIKSDLDRIKNKKAVDTGDYKHSVLVDNFPIYIDDEAIIEPGAILYAEDGPIYIGKGARVMANAVVRGTAAICEKSVVKMGAKIYKDTTIGPVCKVGGEVSNVVFHSYSNKAHDGYAGNSVFGQWCNLGADTNTSNLKNNYSTVRFRDWESGEEVDTGQQFIGTIMGDHSKTGINAMLNTGTLCGVCCNLFSDGYPPKYIPSFSWVSGKDIVPYHFEKAVDAMEKIMQRRNVKLTSAYRELMYSIFNSAT
ncbi:putative sugar nucleotidyl transferase [Rhodohalobacter sp. 8-1]|uniref:putative sugar nucleotidyl transferase n=1 Tax=Rhodohalobacter sp. 8-1 TaxID=3131972 RepID=UPI0030EF4EE3